MPSVAVREVAVQTTCISTSESALVSVLHTGDSLAAHRDVNLPPSSTASVKVFTVPNSIFDGNSTLLFSGRGIVQESKYLIGDRFDDTPIDADKLVELADRVGIGFNAGSGNYYHWMIQCLPAICSYQLLPENERPAVLIPRQRPYQGRSIELAGAEIEPIIFDHRRQYHSAQMDFSTYLNGNSPYRPSPLTTAIWKRMRDQVQARSCGDCIYVSRSDSNNRRMTNEDAVAEMLQSKGFRVVTLTGLSLDEQIRMFASARIVIAPHGAGLTNVVFCDPGCKVYELTPEHYINPCFVRLARSQGIEYWIDAFNSNDDGERHSRSWTADLSVIERRVAELEAAAR